MKYVEQKKVKKYIFYQFTTTGVSLPLIDIGPVEEATVFKVLRYPK